jgi:Fe-S cluster assembly ATPase SufC
MNYSSKKRVKEKIFAYLQNPSKENSIMPAQFFLKFMMKEKSQLSDKQMSQLIDAYIEHYDISKKLFNPYSDNSSQ